MRINTKSLKFYFVMLRLPCTKSGVGLLKTGSFQVVLPGWMGPTNLA